MGIASLRPSHTKAPVDATIVAGAFSFLLPSHAGRYTASGGFLAGQPPSTRRPGSISHNSAPRPAHCVPAPFMPRASVVRTYSLNLGECIFLPRPSTMFGGGVIRTLLPSPPAGRGNAQSPRPAHLRRDTVVDIHQRRTRKPRQRAPGLESLALNKKVPPDGEHKRRLIGVGYNCNASSRGPARRISTMSQVLSADSTLLTAPA
jgi:hypothetical protein